MLLELTIANFAIIEELRLALGPGFNVLTGETGTGKSIIVGAVGLLLGGRAAIDLIRAGAAQAQVEGIFSLEGQIEEAVRPLLVTYGLQQEEDTLILSREINREGRNICRVNGKAIPLYVLSRIGEELVDIHGQSEHLSLLKVRQHIEFLDRYGNLLKPRAQVAEGVRELREVRAGLAKLKADERELARREELLAYQVREISAANLRPGEEERLKQERDILAHAERIIELAEHAYRLLAVEEEGRPSVSDLVGQVQVALDELARLDPRLVGEGELSERLALELEELARNLRTYRERLDYSPARLEELEARLGLIYNLKRKYGASIEEVLAFAKRAEEELEAIAHRDEEIERLERREGELLTELGMWVAELSRRRREAAARLAQEMERELAQLSMERTQFRVEMKHTPDEEGLPVAGERYAFDSTGIDRVEFLISPNPGEPLRPLARIASGGEMARLMLAVKTILTAADHTPTLIFDEIDAGIGPRMGRVVGRKLWGLSAAHQVIVTTHLAQIAAFADRHYQVGKLEADGRTVTAVEDLKTEEAKLTEIAAMLGAKGEAARQSAQSLRDEAARCKGELTPCR